MSLSKSYAFNAQMPWHIQKVIRLLVKQPSTSDQLKVDRLNHYHVSDALSNLEQMGLIRCEDGVYYLIE